MPKTVLFIRYETLTNVEHEELKSGKSYKCLTLLTATLILFASLVVIEYFTFSLLDPGEFSIHEPLGIFVMILFYLYLNKKVSQTSLN